jgi:DNA-binding MarR family transcriptional regulator
MAEFMVDEEGFMTEKSIHELAHWYSEQTRDTDQLSFEVHLMLMRASSTLATGSQFEIRGGLSRARYNVLRILYQNPEQRLLMSEIVEGLRVSPTNITKLVDGLVVDGLVRRVGHSEDKRKTWAELTDKGRHVVELAIPGVAAHTGRLWSGLTNEEKRLLIHLLAKLRMHNFTVDASRSITKFTELLAGAAREASVATAS